MSAMSTRLRNALTILCGVAVVFVGWRFVLPVVMVYLAGVGVFLPFPMRFANAFPRLTAYLFVFGGPALFIGLLLTFFWLLRFRKSHSLGR